MRHWQKAGWAQSSQDVPAGSERGVVSGEAADRGEHEPQREAGGVRGPRPHRPAGGADREGAPRGKLKTEPKCPTETNEPTIKVGFLYIMQSMSVYMHRLFYNWLPFACLLHTCWGFHLYMWRYYPAWFPSTNHSLTHSDKICTFSAVFYQNNYIYKKLFFGCADEKTNKQRSNGKRCSSGETSEWLDVHSDVLEVCFFFTY